MYYRRNDALLSVFLYWIFWTKIVDMVADSVALQRLEGQQDTFVNFMKKQRQLEEALKEAELSALQNQVNPHFLFNSSIPLPVWR